MKKIKGIFDLFKKQEYIEVIPEKRNNKKTGIIAILIFAGILLLAFSGGNGKSEEKSTKTNYDTNEVYTRYITENEKRLEEILSKVSGAGEVRAMITLAETGEKHLAADKKTDRKEQNQGDKSVQEAKTENTVVTYGSGSEEKPFVVKELAPLPSGVLIVASGAGNEGVRLELYEAVRALYGISGHRIKITRGNIN